MVTSITLEIQCSVMWSAAHKCVAPTTLYVLTSCWLFCNDITNILQSITCIHAMCINGSHLEEQVKQAQPYWNECDSVLISKPMWCSEWHNTSTIIIRQRYRDVMLVTTCSNYIVKVANTTEFWLKGWYIQSYYYHCFQQAIPMLLFFFFVFFWLMQILGL